jgi:hypothetical protein
MFRWKQKTTLNSKRQEMSSEKNCQVSGGNVCSQSQTNLMFCKEHYDCLIAVQFKRDLTTPQNRCCWGKTSDPFSRCMAPISTGCGNFCQVHYDQFQSDPSSVPKGTCFIMHTVPAGTIEINLPKTNDPEINFINGLKNDITKKYPK